MFIARAPTPATPCSVSALWAMLRVRFNGVPPGGLLQVHRTV
jgi:hypothetical protein